MGARLPPPARVRALALPLRDPRRWDRGGRREPGGEARDEGPLDAGGNDPVSWDLHARSQIFLELVLPPGHSARIDITPDAAGFPVTVTVFRGDTWLGEVSCHPRLLDLPGRLQEMLDELTGRGVRPMPEQK